MFHMSAASGQKKASQIGTRNYIFVINDVVSYEVSAQPPATEEAIWVVKKFRKSE